jgi:transposase
LLPNATLLRLEACTIDDATHQIILAVRSTQARAPCPVCATPASRIHSHYERTLADLPWAQYRVQLQLRVRKWFCPNRHCRRRIFTERLSTVAAPWARRTLRLAQRLGALGVALGGTAGVQLGHQWDLAVSRNTLLRLLRQQSVPLLPSPTVLGVDDFALRKRQTYGTVLIDLERRQPVALLPDREATTLTQWLQAHPGVAIITRDRARAYADGARHGAPAATQVADRFHVLQNLVEALEQVFHTHAPTLDAVNDALRRQGVRLADGTVAVAVPPPRPTGQQKTAQRRAHRVACHQQVWALRAQGWLGHAIAAQLGIGKSTVFRYLRTTSLPERKRRSDRGRSILTPYKPYLLERWNTGGHDALRLFRELQQRGYAGSYATVARYARRMRQAQGQGPQPRGPRQALPVVAEVRHPLLTARQAAWLVLRREDKRHEDEAHLLTQLREQHAEVATAIDLAQDFAHLVRHRQGAQLDAWLARVAQSTIGALQRFAKGLADDYDAIKAGLTLPWSNGPVEGHITRLKLLKRQMFGRASLGLLQQRFILAPRRGQGRVHYPQVSSEAQAQPAAA